MRNTQKEIPARGVVDIFVNGQRRRKKCIKAQRQKDLLGVINTVQGVIDIAPFGAHRIVNADPIKKQHRKHNNDSGSGTDDHQTHGCDRFH